MAITMRQLSARLTSPSFRLNVEPESNRFRVFSSVMQMRQPEAAIILPASGQWKPDTMKEVDREIRWLVKLHSGRKGSEPEVTAQSGQRVPTLLTTSPTTSLYCHQRADRLGTSSPRRHHHTISGHTGNVI